MRAHLQCPLSEVQKMNGTIIGTSIILRDVTETKKLQDEMKKLGELKTVSQMAASISHEVRNPLTVVKGFNQLLRNPDLTRGTKGSLYPVKFRRIKSSRKYYR